MAGDLERTARSGVQAWMLRVVTILGLLAWGLAPAAAQTATQTVLTNTDTGNAALSLTATVSGAGATPTGTVDFFVGSQLVGTGTLAEGAATITASPNLGPGNTFAFTAVYSGDPNNATSTSAPIVMAR